MRRLRLDALVLLPFWLVAVGHFAAVALPGDGGGFLFVFLGPISVLALVPVVLLHELGHVIGAWLVGRRVHIVWVRPFLLTVRPLRVSLLWRSPGGRVGWVLASPTSLGSGRQRGRYAVFLAGGPIASLAGAALLTAPQNTPTEAAVGSLGLLSIGVGLANLLPTRRTSDGARLLRLSRRQPAAPTPHTAAMLWMSGVARGSWTAWDEAGLRHPRGRRTALSIAAVEALAAGYTREAAERFRALREQGDNGIWVDCALALIASLAGDEKPVRSLLARLDPPKADTGMFNLLAARIHLRDGDRRGARRLLRPLLRGRGSLANPCWRRLALTVMNDGSAVQAPALGKSTALA